MPATEPVFVYGTLRDPGVLARMAGRRGLLRRAIPARLPGYRRVGLRAAPYPTLIRAQGEVRGEVRGLVLRLDATVLRALHRYEGLLYRFVTMRVLTRRGAIRARAWIALPFRASAIAA